MKGKNNDLMQECYIRSIILFYKFSHMRKNDSGQSSQL